MMREGPCIGGVLDGQIRKSDNLYLEAIARKDPPEPVKWGEIPNSYMTVEKHTYRWDRDCWRYIPQ